MNLNWNHIQGDVQSAIGESARLNHLLKSIKMTNILQANDYFSVKLSVENKLILQMTERQILPQLKSVLESRLGGRVEFEIEFNSTQEPFVSIDPAPETATETAAETAADFEPFSTAQPTFKFKNKYVLNSGSSFSSFCQTAENTFAVTAAKHFARATGSDFQLMTLCGPSGTGKTHLLNAVGWELLGLEKGLKVKLISGDDLITDFQAACQKRSMNEFRLKYRLETDVLLIDDIHCLEKAKATQTELFNLLNDFQKCGKKIVLTCDRGVQSFEGFEDRLKSRLLGSLVLELDHPSVSSKLQILNFKLNSQGLRIPEEMIQRILLSSGPCIRSVEGAINRLKMLIQTAGHLDSAILDKMFPVSSEKEIEAISVDAIILRVCNVNKVSVADLKGASRKRHLVAARRECAASLKAELGLTIADIGRILQRDHSTIISLLKAR